MRKTWARPFFGLCSVGALSGLAVFAGVDDKPVFSALWNYTGDAETAVLTVMR